MLSQIDWKTVFVPTASLIEIFLRGTIVYLFLFLVLRILQRRAGTLGISHLLVIVLIADAAQNATASDYKSIPRRPPFGCDNCLLGLFPRLAWLPRTKG
jgi:hypothetical protein